MAYKNFNVWVSNKGLLDNNSVILGIALDKPSVTPAKKTGMTFALSTIVTALSEAK